MTSIQFQPAATGGWLAIVSQNRVLVLETADDIFVREAWVAIASQGAVQAVLELLTRRGLSSTPAFAFVVLDDDASLRVVLRGSLTVTVADASGEHVLSSAGVSTWLERVVESTVGATIGATGAMPAPVGALPVVSGVAWVSSVTLGTTSVASAAAAPDEVLVAAASAPVPLVKTELDAPVPALVPVASTPAVEPVVEVVEPVVEVAQPIVAEPAAAASAPPAPPAPPRWPAPVSQAPAPEPVITAVVDDAQPAPESVAEPVDPEIDLEKTVTDTQLDEQPPPPPPPAPSGYDYLFGDTMYRSVADAAVREPEEEDDEAATGAVGDHDGQTVLTSDVNKLRGRRDAAAPAAPPPPPAAATISLVQSGGTRTALTNAVIIGRSPSASQVSSEFIPTLLTIGGDQDISRNHAQVSLEGGTPVVTDLHSRNGTTVVLPGRSPQKLRAGEATAVIVGTVIDLGGGVTLTLEED